MLQFSNLTQQAELIMLMKQRGEDFKVLSEQLKSESKAHEQRATAAEQEKLKCTC